MNDDLDCMISKIFLQIYISASGGVDCGHNECQYFENFEGRNYYIIDLYVWGVDTLGRTDKDFLSNQIHLSLELGHQQDWCKCIERFKPFAYMVYFIIDRR